MTTSRAHMMDATAQAGLAQSELAWPNVRAKAAAAGGRALSEELCSALVAHNGRVEMPVHRYPLSDIDLQKLLPGTQYMDQPDGGSVTLLEQLQRMAKDAERYRWLRHGDNDDICIEFADGLDGMYADQVWLLRGEKLDAVIDAGIAHDKDEAAHTVAVPAVGAA